MTAQHSSAAAERNFCSALWPGET